MWQTIKQLIKDSLTEDDGVHYCGAKIAAYIALISFLYNATYSIYISHGVDLNSFGVGLAAVLGGCGVLIAGKQMTQK